MLYCAGYVQLMNLHVHVLHSFFLHFEYRILQDMFNSLNLHILLSLFTLFVVFHRSWVVQQENIYVSHSLFTLSYVTGRVQWNNTHVLQSLFTLNDVFYRTFLIEVSPSIRLSLRLQCLLCFKKHGKQEIYICQRISLLSKCILHRIIRKSD